MYYAEFCAPLKSRATAKFRRLYQSAVELLPIWIMFIDRIIDRIWTLAVVLTTELLNPHQFEASCRVVVECNSLLAAQISAIKRCPQCRRPCILYCNAIHSIWGILFNGINPDRITLQQMFFSIIGDILLWSNQCPFLICILLVKDW